MIRLSQFSHHLRLSRIVVALVLVMCCVSGFAQFNPAPGFRNVSFGPWEAQKSNLVTGIIQDRRGYMWIASSNGLFRFDGTNMKVYLQGTDSSTLSTNALISVYEDSDGQIWLGTRGGGLDLYDPILDQFDRHADPMRNDLTAWCFYEPDSVTMWIGCKDYLVRFDRDKNTCKYYSVDNVPDHFTAIRDIIPYQNDTTKLWLGTLFGLKSFDIQSEKLTDHPMPATGFTRPDSKGDYLIMDVIQRPPNDIWGTSWGGGILHYDISNRKWNQYKVGRPHTDPRRWKNVIFDFYPKSEDEFWVASSHGAGIFNTATKQYSFFEEGDDPLLPPSFNYDVVCTTRNGHLTIGRYGGFSISMSPIGGGYEMPLNDYPPEILSIEVDGHPYVSDTTPAYISLIQLDKDDKDVTFGIISPGALNTSGLTYSYKLEGYDKEWQAASGTDIRYTNLGPGAYTLHFRTSRDGKTWEYGNNVIKIRKATPLWLNPWLYIGAILFILAVTTLIYWMNIRSVKRTAKLKSEYDQKIAGIEMAALRAQMNPHFMFNSLNSIKAYILKEKTNEASQYLTKFSKLMRAVLRNSKSQLVTLEDEISALRLYVELEALRFEDEFEYVIEIDSSINTAEVVIPPLLVQPYVENAIRHGLLEKEFGLKQLLIKAKKTAQNEILITIEDNGIGREAASKKQPLRSTQNRSFGMEITGDRIALIQQTLGIRAHINIRDLFENDQPAGTRVELRIPWLLASESLT